VSKSWANFHFWANYPFKEIKSKIKICHHLLILMLLWTCNTSFLSAKKRRYFEECFNCYKESKWGPKQQRMPLISPYGQNPVSLYLDGPFNTFSRL